MANLNRLLLCLALLSFVGCTTPYGTPEIKGDPPTRAIGIAEVLNQDSLDEVDVLMIHGMCTHDKNWVADSNNNLLKVLKINETVDANALKPTAVFSQTELYSLTFQYGNKRIRTHSIVWSPATLPYKSRLCYDQSADRTGSTAYCQGKPDFPYKRSKLNSVLKSRLLDDCLADAMVYAGPARQEIMNQVAGAITYAAGIRARDKSMHGLLRQGEIEETPLFIISESLGSKILFDTLSDMITKKQERLVSQSMARVTQIYMTANQIPVLSLAAPVGAAKAREAETTGIGTDSLNVLLQQLKTKAAVQPKLRNIRSLLPAGKMQVVAFSDPNDLLSYGLHESGFEETANYKIIDVFVSNAPTWFGLIENPLSAHQTYRDNKAVNTIIVCGIPEMAGCPAK